MYKFNYPPVLWAAIPISSSGSRLNFSTISFTYFFQWLKSPKTITIEYFHFKNIFYLIYLKNTIFSIVIRWKVAIYYMHRNILISCRCPRNILTQGINIFNVIGWGVNTPHPFSSISKCLYILAYLYMTTYCRFCLYHCEDISLFWWKYSLAKFSFSTELNLYEFHVAMLS